VASKLKGKRGGGGVYFWVTWKRKAGDSVGAIGKFRKYLGSKTERSKEKKGRKVHSGREEGTDFSDYQRSGSPVLE